MLIFIHIDKHPLEPITLPVLLRFWCEVEKVTKFLSDQSIPDYDETITEEPESSYNESVYGLANKNNNQNDELYDQAVALIARERKASTSFIQRYFKIGYNRAATIIEKMEENSYKLGNRDATEKVRLLCMELLEETYRNSGRKKMQGNYVLSCF